jgi:hypothetical protein
MKNNSDKIYRKFKSYDFSDAKPVAETPHLAKLQAQEGGRFAEQYLVDAKGRRKAVVVPISEWREILEALEELEDIREYDKAKKKRSDPIPFKGAESAR